MCIETSRTLFRVALGSMQMITLDVRVTRQTLQEATTWQSLLPHRVTIMLRNSHASWRIGATALPLKMTTRHQRRRSCIFPNAEDTSAICVRTRPTIGRTCCVTRLQLTMPASSITATYVRWTFRGASAQSPIFSASIRRYRTTRRLFASDSTTQMDSRHR